MMFFAWCWHLEEIALVGDGESGPACHALVGDAGTSDPGIVFAIGRIIVGFRGSSRLLSGMTTAARISQALRIVLGREMRDAALFVVRHGAAKSSW
jgi:hypothetical protein